MEGEYDWHNLWLRDASWARCKMHGEWGDGTLRKLRENDLAFVWLYRNRGLRRLDHEGTELSVNFSIMLSGQKLLVCMYIYLYKAATSQNVCHFFFAPREIKYNMWVILSGFTYFRISWFNKEIVSVFKSTESIEPALAVTTRSTQNVSQQTLYNG